MRRSTVIIFYLFFVLFAYKVERDLWDLGLTISA